MTTTLDKLFDLDYLDEMMAEGYVKVQHHPSLPLNILNYAPKAQYENEWNEVTRACRGLIYDTTTNVVLSRPFPKFFNWDQMGAPRLPVGPVRVGPKMDGSLGVLYEAQDVGCSCHAYRIATRGSFASDQARVGTDIYREMAEDSGFEPWPDRTYLFEIIYPANRIVVDYGSRSTLVLLDVVDNATGKSDLAAFDEAMWFDKVTWTMVPEFDHRLIESIPDGDEGLVFYWHNQDVRVKMKAAEYVRLHRIVTNTSTKTIWEHLSSGRSVNSLLESVPDEFYDWVRQAQLELQHDFTEIEVDALLEFSGVSISLMQIENEKWTQADRRREFARLAKDTKYSDILFKMLDSRDYSDAIWKRIKPAYSKAFTNQTEDVS